ncbi:MAG: DUF1173 domain-containing protein [Sulfuritalea sp.]|nr:DUF1173 domain-containing protein [Sulfuritalea sp.]
MAILSEAGANCANSSGHGAQRVRVGTDTHAVEWLLRTVTGQGILASAHAAGERPRCQCVPATVEMYVAKRGRRYYLARMPGSGPLHAPHCNSLEAANLLSGMDCYAEGALAHEMDGAMRVRFDAAVELGENLPACGMNGLLDVLIEGAGLNVVAVGAEPRVRSAEALQRLRDAATKVLLADRGPLSRFLLVPEPFEKERADVQNEGYLALLASDPLPLVCSTIRTLQPSEFGWLLRLKHLPRIKFWLSQTTGAALFSRCAGTLGPEDVIGSLCLLQVKQGRSTDSFSVKGIALRQIDARKMPVLSNAEMVVANELVLHGSGFVRPLRFDAPWSRVLADYLLTQDAAASLAFVFSPTGCTDYDEAKKRVAGPLIRGGIAIELLPAGSSGESPPLGP